tara:strand:+ start:26 stop:574 length:549 start_codon:yes stop_codon:yes gene_type:complete
MRIQPLIYHFEYQRKGNTRKSIKGRFAQSDAIKKHWSQYDNISSYENPHRKDTRNEVLGFRKFARAFNKINTTHEIVDVNDYVMPIYKHDFIKVESFVPRNSNRLKYRLNIPTFVSKLWPNKRRSPIDIKNNIPKITRLHKEQSKVFNSTFKINRYAKKLEEEYINKIKKHYEDYYKEHKYT